MAATQAENQQNEVNRDQVQQDQPPDLNNVVLQNGTEKNGGRIILGAENIVNTKTKSPGQNSLAVEMSQYRQESGAGPPIHNSSGNGEQNVNSAGIESSKLNSDGKSFQQNSEQSTGSDQNYSKGPDGNGQNMQGFSLGFPARGSYHPDQHGPGNPVQNSTESNLHQNHPFSQFNPQSMRHGFPTSKPMPGSQMVPPRPPSGGQNMNAPGGFPPHAQQQRFLSGQSISQPTGPTPTLNQLLQSPNPVHRYQNSCGDFGMQKSTEQVSGNIPYNQSWPPQRPLTSYSPQQVPSYRNQPPGGVARGSQSPYLGGQGSGPGSGVFSQQQQQQQPTSQPTAPLPQQPGNQQQQQYPSYPQRYPTPPGPGPVGRAAFSPHQLGSPYGQQPPPSQSQQMYGGPGGDQRSSWGQPQPGPPQASQQAPATPQPSPQPPPPPQPSPHPPPSPNQQHPPPQQSPQHSQQSSFPSRPQQPSTPNAHAPDAGDQNSNDSSSGPAPGTPNSQGMRPTPSPTGSTGSRSMSPAVGQQNIPMPPRPSSGQSDGSGPTRLSHSPMSSQSSYQQPLAPPGPHNMHGGYKMGVGGHPGMVPPGGQQMTPFSPQSQQYPQGNYNPRPQGQLSGVQYPGSGGHSQGYGVAPSQGPTPQQSPQPNSMASGQYPSRPIPNHVAHSQFGGYQGWGGPAVNQGQGPGMMSGKGPGPQNSGVTPQVVTNSPRAHTPPHYLKHHLQQKMGFGGSSSSPLQVGGYSSGPPMVPGPGPGPSSNSAPGMGPPGSNMHQHHSMGPPSSGSHHHPGMGPPPSGVGNSLSMGPPSSSVVSAPTSVPPSMGVVGNSSGPSLSNSHHDDPMPPPSASSHGPELGGSVGDLADNVIITTTSAVAGTTTNVTQSVPGSVTSVVTTGPDGAPIDEGSQQSTLSNASAASGEDPSCTPKSRKDGTVVGGYHSHPPTPQSTVASPGAASLTSMHEEYGDVNSPTSWPRTPASPVFNSHVHQDPYRAKKPDSLCKLYDMDESHERRMWLDKLLQFMDERGTPISACPTISKNPLDLFRLYLYVKERGGFMEVCKVTKNKTWKDIAGLLGIGASSSAAYTLRKHYTKNLLAYECHFDRGGIDPQPIINQVEASSKKKGAKATSVPSPGSSNSQDSFPTASTGSMDGYGYGYPPGSTPDYNSPPMQRPATQTNAPSPHAGMQPGYQSQSGYSQYQEQYGQQYHPANTPNYRPMCPPYSTGEATERGYNQSTGGSGGSQPTASMPQGPPGQDPYNRYQPPGYAVNRAGYPPPTAPSSGPPGTPQQPGYPPQDNYYRQDQMPQSVSYPSSQLARQLVAPHSHAKSPYQQQVYASQQAGSSPSSPAGQMYPGGPQSKSMPPPAPQPRRHPDFAKEQQAYPPGPYTQHRPAIYGWSNNSQFRGQFPPQGPGAVPQAPQQWAQGPPRPAGAQPSNNQWDQHRYPPAGQPPYQPPSQSQQQWMSNMPTPGVGQSSPLRPPMGPRPPFRPEGKPFPMPPPPGSKGQPPNTANASYPQTAPPKREIVFPPDSVEATTPVLYKRKRMTRGDVAPVEAWRLMMSLRSGLLAESCWALDVLNILLFDDSTVTYFGLAHLPGLLDVLLEHFRRSLADIFDNTPILPDMDRKWYRQAWPEVSDVDLGAVTQPMNPEDRTMLLESTTNYTLQSRKGDPVKVASREGDIFVLDSRKSWDVHGDVAEDCVGEPEPDTSSTNYIITCFQGEFGNVPFVRLLSNKCKDHQEEITLEEPIVSEDDRKNCDKKKRTKSLSDVLLRIKKEPGEANDILTREIREKVEKCEGKKDDDTQPCDFKKEKCESLEEQDCDVSANGVIVKKELSEEENNVATSNSSDCDKNETVDIDSKEKEEKIESPIGEIKDDGATNIKIRDPAGTLKRRRMSDYEDECYTRDEASLYLVTETQDAIARRCICLSNILRNLTFVPGNELEFAKNPTFLGLLGKLLLLHHEHPARTHKQRNYDREEDADFADSCSSLQGEAEWWWDFLHHVRENVLVTAANIAGHMDLGQYPEEISRPVLDGLLHWAVCPAAHGQDSFPTVGLNSSLSPQRLALEALCKLCVTDSNVDLVIATPPYSRLERLCAVLTKLLCRSEEQVLREFGVNLLHYLAAADSAVARTVALQSPCVSLLVAFIEQAEASALGVASQHGIGALRENPDSMGTSLDMLRRAAGTLLHLSRHPDNRPLFLQQEQRLLALVMSQILDQQVASILARVLFQCSRPS